MSDELKVTHTEIEAVAKNSQFMKELEHLINRYSLENGSNTPDFILAQYLASQLEVFNQIVMQREKWYGREPKTGPIVLESPKLSLKVGRSYRNKLGEVVTIVEKISDKEFPFRGVYNKCLGHASFKQDGTWGTTPSKWDLVSEVGEGEAPF